MDAKPLSFEHFNQTSVEDATQMLDGLYEHTPWIADKAVQQRPFASIAALQLAMAQILDEAGDDAKRALINAHPELAGKAMQTHTLTTESQLEQTKAGLTACTPDDLAHIATLNAAYRTKHGFGFILAVLGARGVGLSKAQILATFERRLHNSTAMELQEAIRNVHRIVQIRLQDKFGVTPIEGNTVWDACEALAQFSEPPYQDAGQLTITYLTPEHQACARLIAQQMQAAGFDSVHIDAVGNVVGRYEAENAILDAATHAKTLLTGSHYDTVRNGGKYDGRLGIYVPMVVVQKLKQRAKRLPFAIELVAFAEEEGQRYKATFLASSALAGHFDAAWLDQTDAQGVTMRQAMQAAGMPATLEAVKALKRDASRCIGFVEVHIEQGPVLAGKNLPLGVVTSINGSKRFLGHVQGVACHAGTTPMRGRRDAAVAVGQWLQAVESRAQQDADTVATVGMLGVPNGSINVVPGRCDFSLDVRAPNDSQRDAAVADIVQSLAQICHARGVTHQLEMTMQAAAAPSSPVLQAAWEQAVSACGLPVYRMPSGAGHDAMKLHDIMPQAMLFVRGENDGISHNPLESTTNHDMQLAVQAFEHLILNLST